MANLHWKYTKRVNEALELQKQIDKLVDEQGDLLDPVLDKVIAGELDDEQIQELVDTLPGGYHRSEIRGILRRNNG